MIPGRVQKLVEIECNIRSKCVFVGNVGVACQKRDRGTSLFRKNLIVKRARHMALTC